MLALPSGQSQSIKSHSIAFRKGEMGVEYGQFFTTKGAFHPAWNPDLMGTSKHPELTVRVGSRMLTAELVSSEAAIFELAESMRIHARGREYGPDPHFYLASVLPQKWTPRVVAVRENDQILGLLFTKERKIARLNTGLLLADSSLGTAVLSDDVNREDVLCAAIHYLFSALHVRGLRMLIPPEGTEMAAIQKTHHELSFVDVDVFHNSKARHGRLPLPVSYEEFLNMLGKSTRRNFRRYRRRFEDGHNQYVEQIPYLDFAEAVVYLIGKCRAGGGLPSFHMNPDNMERFLRMLAVAQEPLLAGLRRSDGQWMAIIGGWRESQTATVVLQLNDDSSYPNDSLSVVLRSYVVDTLINRGIRHVTFWAGASAPLASHCNHVPVIAVHLDARTHFWRLFRYSVAQVVSWFPQVKNAAVWIAPPAATRIKAL
jgi:hypothetical protein